MYLAIDYGKKRIGLALGEIIPRGAGIINAALSRQTVLSQIAEICRQEEVKAIIIGLPFRSQGEEGTLAPEIRAFGRKLSEATHLPVIFEPEAFTSTESAALLQTAKKGKYSKGEVDELAAVLILEQYLNHAQKESGS